MPTLSSRQISEVVCGITKSRDAGKDVWISSLSSDSRTIFDPESTLFFAIRSDRNDGHKYVDDLIEKGVRLFVVSEYSEEWQKSEQCIFIVVPDTLQALQKLVAWHRSQFSIPVVGITGSNGKTIVKEWLFEILRNRAVIRSPKSYNSQIGVPLSVWNLGPDYELAIFEAGISKPGEMQNLFEIIRPTIGILTNLGEAHQENFSSHREKLREKLRLFRSCHSVIYCMDQALTQYEFDQASFLSEIKKYGWSFQDVQAGLYFRKTELETGMEIRTNYGGTDYQIRVPFKDDASLENIGHCLAFLITQNYADKETLGLFQGLEPLAMRLEMKEGIQNCLLINDYYNSDINSLQIALSFLNSQASHPNLKKTVIMSDIQQSGIPDAQLYREVARLLQLNKITRMIGIGPKISGHNDLFHLQAEFYSSTEMFLESFIASNFRNECILIKGARNFHLELVSAVLQKKYHQTVLEIDLNKLIGNLNYFRSSIAPETRVMVMVKAFSYGSGMVEIARVLQFHKVDYLAVAVADEGIELRQAGIDVPIVIMNPEEHSFESMIEFRLEPNIYSEELFEAFYKVLQQHAVSKYPVHLKIDTGMHRLGFDTAEKLNFLAEKLASQSEMVVRSVFSHLAGSDEAIHDDFTQSQVERFKKLSSIITGKLNYKVFRHILNSAGIERFPEFQFEMVRLGIGLYGVSANGAEQVQSISRLKTSISQIRLIPAGQTVGYGRKGVVSSDSEIAVLPVGYADGYDRRLSNGVGKVYLNGKIVPIIGNVCMDMCMIDVTGLSAAVGDEVELMGDHILVSEIAGSIGTIPYEILTGISQRVKRIYLQE